MLRGACGCCGGRTVGLKRLFESDVGGGGGGCCEAVVERDVGGGGLVVVGGWSQNNNSKRKTATSKITALLTRIIPSEQQWGNLSEHRLIGITDLRTLMVVCECPQP